MCQYNKSCLMRGGCWGYSGELLRFLSRVDWAEWVESDYSSAWERPVSWLTECEAEGRKSWLKCHNSSNWTLNGAPPVSQPATVSHISLRNMHHCSLGLSVQLLLSRSLWTLDSKIPLVSRCTSCIAIKRWRESLLTSKRPSLTRPTFSVAFLDEQTP